VIFFSDKVEKYIAPKKGKQHALFIVRELLTVEPKGKGTNLAEALKFFNRMSRQKSIAFVMSDMLDERYDDDLRVVANRHDVIGLKIYDKMDMQLPEIGMIQVEDFETGQNKWIDTGNVLTRHNYQQHFLHHSEQTKTIFRKAGAELLHLRTDDDYVKILQEFFIKRS
jgi:uncharacterized protein (DUF58 family)